MNGRPPIRIVHRHDAQAQDVRILRAVHKPANDVGHDLLHFRRVVDAQRGVAWR